MKWWNVVFVVVIIVVVVDNIAAEVAVVYGRKRLRHGKGRIESRSGYGRRMESI